jgi:hypothetical protein
MKTLRFLMVVMLIASVSTTLSAQKKVNPVGTWTYQADQAPYEYNSGEIVIAKDGKDYTVKIVLGEYYELKASSVTYEKNELSFRIYVEGESVSVKGTVGKETIEGTASYSEGTIPIAAKRKKK